MSIPEHPSSPRASWSCAMDSEKSIESASRQGTFDKFSIDWLIDWLDGWLFDGFIHSLIRSSGEIIIIYNSLNWNKAIFPWPPCELKWGHFGIVTHKWCSYVEWWIEPVLTRFRWPDNNNTSFIY